VSNSQDTTEGDASVAAVAASLREGTLSAAALVEGAISLHSQHGEAFQAYKMFDADGATAAARKADECLASGNPGPLCGVPISVKDLYGVDGMPTFAGSVRQLPADRWSHDAWLVRRLREAGAVIVGKTHTVEFAYGGVGINPHWDTPWNPWDAEVARIPGGSSCGAGGSLWEGSALLALGSDTGGSIRIPAAYTGVVGHKATQGRWPTTGVSQLSSTFDTVGALTRTVEDAIYFFGTVDPAWSDPIALMNTLSTQSINGLRLALPGCGIWDDCQQDISAVLHKALSELVAAGSVQSDVDGTLINEAHDHYMNGGIGKAECHAFLSDALPEWLDILHPTVGRRLQDPLPLDGDAYRCAIEKQREMATASSELFANADLLVLPTNIITAPPIEGLSEDLGRYGTINATTLRPTCPINLLGLCAVSMPVGLDNAGMPVGLQLIGRGGQDETLLGAALAIERVLGTGAGRMGTPPLLKGRLKA
jgi:aspartyl-tRNA(Asn)/glutamyl-tRNA(Gln) amidotransferase subunit A